jgi:putative spermidine/putrescine transport system substrate-binding protein
LIPAWSDQALQVLKAGVLPETVKVVQLQDLALCGGFASLAVPVNATDHAGAMAPPNVVLSPEMQTFCVRESGGFPGISWDNLPPERRAESIDVIPVSIPTFPSGDWNTAMNDGWYRNVATNLTRDGCQAQPARRPVGGVAEPCCWNRWPDWRWWRCRWRCWHGRYWCRRSQ